VLVTTAVRARTALQLTPAGSHVSHETAAELWGVASQQDTETHISVPRGAARSERRGIRTHQAHPSAVVVQRKGLPISSPAQTFLDLAGRLPLVELVAVGDALVKAGRLTRTELIEAADSWRGHGGRTARRAARYVRDDVDSPMESRLRMLIVLAGLPEPVVNHILRTPDGEWDIRFDLYYASVKVVIEYDGRQHRTSKAQRARDLRRREELDRRGYRLVVIEADGIYDDPAETLRRISSVLRERGMRIRRVLDDEWWQHFPGRSRTSS
jgi:hypothetical protein